MELSTLMPPGYLGEVYHRMPEAVELKDTPLPEGLTDNQGTLHLLQTVLTGVLFRYYPQQDTRLEVLDKLTRLAGTVHDSKAEEFARRIPHWCAVYTLLGELQANYTDPMMFFSWLKQQERVPNHLIVYRPDTRMWAHMAAYAVL